MRYRHRVPRPPLDSFIESIWVYQNDPRPNALERVLTTGAARWSATYLPARRVLGIELARSLRLD